MRGDTTLIGLRLLGGLYGADDDDGATGSGQDSNDDDASGQEPTDGKGGQEPSAKNDDKSGGETVPRSMLEEVRREAAATRKKLREMEEKEAERAKAEMSEKERAEAERDEAKAKTVAANKRIVETLINTNVQLAASEQGFADPEDAVALIDRSKLEFDEETGEPVTKSIKAAVKALSASKPHLLKSSNAGSGDGGPKGKPGPKTFDDRKKKYADEFKDRGFVSIETG